MGCPENSLSDSRMESPDAMKLSTCFSSVMKCVYWEGDFSSLQIPCSMPYWGYIGTLASLRQTFLFTDHFIYFLCQKRRCCALQPLTYELARLHNQRVSQLQPVTYVCLRQKYIQQPNRPNGMRPQHQCNSRYGYNKHFYLRSNYNS